VTVPDLLARARASGLSIRREGERLVVRGPRSLGTLALEVLALKPEVLLALELEAARIERCPACGTVWYVLAPEGYLAALSCCCSQRTAPAGAGTPRMQDRGPARRDAETDDS